MSMLAGPRRKQKVINLRAKNNAWSNDANKFGQRMLEKMGWSSGKGLGANENGIVEHVVARYKNDEKGLGFQDKNDQWTKHEDDFNMLLANLSNDDSSAEKLHSGISLEVKSKKSKARVHYHKFTRGKDLTRYSEKDLANIFGKKSLKNEEKIEEVLKIVQTTEQVFTEKGSMEDYFKNKLASFKMKNNVQELSSNEADNSVDYAFQGFSSNIDYEAAEVTHQGFGFQLNSENNSKNNQLNEENIIASHDTQICDPEPLSIKKKNKKSKVKMVIENAVSDISESVTKKKERKKMNTLAVDNLIINSIPLDCNERKIHDDYTHLKDFEGSTQVVKVKKSKKKIKVVQEVLIEDVQNVMEDTVPLERKKKKRHHDDCIKLNDPEETVQEMVKVKKSKNKDKDVQEQDRLENVTEIDKYLPKKKKRKNKEKYLGNQ